MKRQLELKSTFLPSGDQPEAIKRLKIGINNGISHQTLLGVTGSGKTFTIANLIADIQYPTIILAPNKTLAAQMYGEMKEFFPKNAVEYFVSYYDYYQPESYLPISDTFIEKDASINLYIEQMRISTIKSLLERRDIIIIASVSAIYGIGNLNIYLKMIMHLNQGMIIDQRTLLYRLIELQYIRNDKKFNRGMFRVHGEIIDIFPVESEDYALRIELFDEIIKSLSIFDPLTNNIKSNIKCYTIYPKTQYIITREMINYAIEKIQEELYEQRKILLNNNKLIEEQRLNQRTQFDLEMMKELGYCSGIENYSRYLSNYGPGEPPLTLFNYLPVNSLLVIDESHVTIPQIRSMYYSDRSRKEVLVKYGFRLPSALDNRPLKFEEFENLIPKTVYVSATPGDYELKKSNGSIVDQLVRPTGLLDPIIEVRSVTNQIDDIISEINKRIIINERVLVTTLTKKMAESLTEYLGEHGILVRYLHSDIDTIERTEIIRDLRLGKFDVLVGINLLREGLDIPEVSLVAILDADKEGFLRSERSLIQTIGRASRNINGMAILYGNKITLSMTKAINETKRRRKKQQIYNINNGIVPKKLDKKIVDILSSNDKLIKIKNKKYYKTHMNEKQSKYFKIDTEVTNLPVEPKILQKKIQELENRMVKYAKNLEFEEAMKLRDQIYKLRKIF